MANFNRAGRAESDDDKSESKVSSHSRDASLASVRGFKKNQFENDVAALVEPPSERNGDVD